MRRHRRLHLQRGHRRHRGAAPSRSRRPRRPAQRQSHRQLAADPRVPAPRHRAPRVRARASRRWPPSWLRWGSAPMARPRRASSSCSTSCAWRSATSASTSAWPTSRGSTPTWCAAPRTAIPASRRCARACAVRRARRCRWATAADAIVRGVQRRSRRVVAPGFVGALYRLRGLIPELIDREALKSAPDVDRMTAEMVAERGAFGAGLRPGERPVRPPPAPPGADYPPLGALVRTSSGLKLRRAARR